MALFVDNDQAINGSLAINFNPTALTQIHSAAKDADSPATRVNNVITQQLSNQARELADRLAKPALYTLHKWFDTITKVFKTKLWEGQKENLSPDISDARPDQVSKLLDAAKILSIETKFYNISHNGEKALEVDFDIESPNGEIRELSLSFHTNKEVELNDLNETSLGDNIHFNDAAITHNERYNTTLYECDFKDGRLKSLLAKALENEKAKLTRRRSSMLRTS